MAKGVTIPNAERVKEVTGKELIPVSDGTTVPRCMSAEDIAALAASKEAVKAISDAIALILGDAETEGSIANMIKAAVDGLGSAAFTDSEDYATSEQGKLADNAVQAPEGGAAVGHVPVFGSEDGKSVTDSGYTIAASVPKNAVFTDTDTTYSFVSGEDGSFTVTASNGTEGVKVSVGKPDSAGTADKVANVLTLQLGDTEGGSKLTYDGSEGVSVEVTTENIGAEVHSHSADEVTAMKGYALPKETEAIAATDTLNVAVGKLERSMLTIGAMVADLSTDLGKIEETLTGIDGRISKLDTSLSALTGRVTALESKVSAIEDELTVVIRFGGDFSPSVQPYKKHTLVRLNGRWYVSIRDTMDAPLPLLADGVTKKKLRYTDGRFIVLSDNMSADWMLISDVLS